MASCPARNSQAARDTDGRAAVAATCGLVAGLRSRRVLRAPAATANPRATIRDGNRSHRRCWIPPADRDRRATMATRSPADQTAG